MDKKSKEGVPALENDDVTGMSEAKQEKIIERSGRTDRGNAAKEFYDEQEDQAAGSKPPTGKQSAPAKGAGPSMEQRETQGEAKGEFDHRWKDAATGSASPGKGEEKKKKG